MSNASIILSGRTIPIDRAANRAKGQAAANAQLQTAANTVNLVSGIDKLKREQGTRNALKGIDPNAPDFYKQAATAVAPVDPTAARSYVEKGFAWEKNLTEHQKAKLDNLVTQTQLVGQVLGNAEDDAQWQAGIRMLSERGVPVDSLPQVNPGEEARQKLIYSALNPKEQIDASFKRRSAKLAENRFEFDQSKQSYQVGQDEIANARAVREEQGRWFDRSQDVAAAKLKERKEKREAEKSEREKYEDKRTFSKAAKSVIDRSATVQREIDAIKKLMDLRVTADGKIVTEDVGFPFALPDTGYGAGLAKYAPGDARKIEQHLITLRSLVGFGELQKMRESSKTGGAVGNLSEREFTNLAAAKGLLEVQNENLAQVIVDLERDYKTVAEAAQFDVANYDSLGEAPASDGITVTRID